MDAAWAIAAVESPPPRRIRTPLPSKTQGPTSFLGVMGPSLPFAKAGWAVGGEGVLADSSGRLGIEVLMLLLLGLEEVGMPMGVEVAFIDTLRLLDDLGRAPMGLSVRLTLFDEMALAKLAVASFASDGASVMVRSITSGDCCIVVFDGMAGVSSLDLRGGGIAWLLTCCCRSAAAASSSCCSSGPSSESTCSHSSGSSTSASRSAAALQLGQIKIGYEGEESKDRIHL